MAEEKTKKQWDKEIWERKYIERCNICGESRIILGDCLEKLKDIESNSVDSIVTDPPYELGFMGKKWDNSGIAYNVELWKECIRVLKPGGYLLSFGGTRTYHRMAITIEDAGFEIRDMIEWVYGSGFPKSHNIGKSVDKLLGNDREEWEEKRNGGGVVKGQAYEGGFTQVSGKRLASKGASEYEGWGTALKPAHEPICMARKPLAEKTVALNCLKWGAGGINIDISRVEGTTANGRFPANLIHDNSQEVRECFPDSNATNRNNIVTRKDDSTSYGGKSGQEFTRKEFGDSGNASRFFKSIIYTAKASKSERNKGCEGMNNNKPMYESHRPNYENTKGIETPYAGAGRTGNLNQNNHPTVKPISLMEYLIKMVTPKGGIVLDPFAGSGTTLVASKQNGFKYIGIEMTEEYIPIIEARLKSVKEM